jgi:biopolymer transport protein ExbB
MIELLIRGGWVMIPILLCSLVSLGVIIERLVTYKKVDAESDFMMNLRLLLVEHKIKEAIQYCKKSKGVIPQIALVGIENEAKEMTEIIRIVEDEARTNVIPNLEKHLPVLDTIYAGTPLLGLLGTVIGMIKMFDVVNVAGLGNASSLAGGIGEALITTASGLIVAIPTLFVYNYLERRVAHFTLLIERSIYDLYGFLSTYKKHLNQETAQR